MPVSHASVNGAKINAARSRVKPGAAKEQFSKSASLLPPSLLEQHMIINTAPTRAIGLPKKPHTAAPLMPQPLGQIEHDVLIAQPARSSRRRPMPTVENEHDADLESENELKWLLNKQGRMLEHGTVLDGRERAAPKEAERRENSCCSSSTSSRCGSSK
jgi:hypothetical protein